MRLLGLIGFPLEHSFSPAWFKNKFKESGDINIDYRLFPLDSVNDFPSLLLEEPELTGLNVTIPYKEQIIPFLDELDETARLIGAVNTIKISKSNGKIHTKGFNTDYPGFRKSLEDYTRGSKALILGTGGAARSVSFALDQMKISYKFVSRSELVSGTLKYPELTREMISEHTLIINTTPLGMYPDTDTFPEIPYHYLSADHLLYDLVYNPKETLFLQKGAKFGARTVNGQKMLEYQADIAYQIFMDR
jgi:shikimate dehydrogenase